MITLVVCSCQWKKRLYIEQLYNNKFYYIFQAFYKSLFSNESITVDRIRQLVVSETDTFNIDIFTLEILSPQIFFNKGKIFIQTKEKPDKGSYWTGFNKNGF